jgi:hypothetical protein
MRSDPEGPAGSPERVRPRINQDSATRENRRVLQTLATRAAGRSPDSSREISGVTSAGKRRAGHSLQRKSVLLVAVALVTGVWMLYANWSRQDAASAPSIRHTDARPALVPTDSTSAAAGQSAEGALHAKAPSMPLSRGDDQAPKQHEVAGDDFEERIRSIEAAVSRRESGAVSAVLMALEDDDWRLRSRALDAAVNSFIAIPEDVLIDRAQFDPSPEVRFLALSGLAARLDPPLPDLVVDPASAGAISRLALNDPSEHVRWQAQQILDALDGTQGAMDSDQPNAGPQ